MSRKILRAVGIAFLIAAVLLVAVPVPGAQAVVLDDFQMDHDSLDKYEGAVTTVSIPDAVKKIGEEAFAGNQTLAQIDTGMNTKSIEHGAFANCPYLYSVTTHDKLEEIDTAAFAGDVNLTSINLGANVNKLGYGIFAGCNKLNSITISRNNSAFVVSGAGLYNHDGDMLYAYMGGASPTYFRMPNSVKNISKYCFWGNDVLDSVSISSYVENIPAYAFSNCRNLKTVNIPYSVTTIDAKAFENCVSLADVSIPASVNYIDPTAFDGCSKLNIIADPGTAAYEFFKNFDRSDVANVENGDVNVVIYPDEDVSSGATTREEGDELDYMPSYVLLDASVDPSNVDYMPKSDPLLGPDSEEIIAKTIVVGGRAVLFLDPNQTVHEGTLYNPEVMTVEPADGDTEAVATQDGTYEEPEDDIVIYDSSKGGYLPKYVTVGDKISSQAYYAKKNMDGYQIPAGIHSIGDFAFARSTLSSIVIPEGVTDIGYAAFYHCNNLTDVSIPSSVVNIEGNAFDNTPYINNFKSDISSGDFLIVGDGILLAYSGSNAVVTIPEGVKQIAPSVFSGHTEITGVDLPASLKKVGEDAFRGCTSLSSVTGGGNVETIGDRAYMNCPLATCVIPASVRSMGLRAVDYSGTSKEPGTKVVVFEGGNIPVVTSGNISRRLENDNYRQDALYNVLFAIVDGSINDFKGTVLDNDYLGFSGIILSKEKDASGNDTGNLIMKENYIFSEEVLNTVPDTVSIAGTNYTIKDKGNLKLADNNREADPASMDVVTLYNNTLLDNVTARLSESESVGVLKIDSSADAGATLGSKYAELFGQSTPEIAGYDITLTDATGTVPINKFGNSSLTVTMPIPDAVKGGTYHVVTVDSDGQLEEVKASVDNNDMISFSTSHLSPFGIYSTGSDSTTSILKNGKTVTNYKKDASPDTGDSSIPVKYVGAFACLCIGLFALIYRRKAIV